MKQILFLLGILIYGALNAQVVTTVAGAPWNFPSTIAAKDAPLASAVLVAVDAAGTIYGVDSAQQLIFKIDASGTLKVIGGGGSDTQSDGIPATSARFYTFGGIAADATGNIYFADTGLGWIRKIATDGTISTLATQSGITCNLTQAQAGSVNVASVAVDQSGNTYVADRFNRCIVQITPSGARNTIAGIRVNGNSVPVLYPSIDTPYSIAVDGTGYVYYLGPNGLHQVAPGGPEITLLGTGQSIPIDGAPGVYQTPTAPSLAIDSSGNFYIADFNRNQVLKFDPKAKTLTTIVRSGPNGFAGDGGPALNATLYFPESIAVGPAGNIVLADGGNRRVRQINSAGIINTVAGNGLYKQFTEGVPATSTFISPAALAFDPSGRLLVGQGLSVKRIDASGTINTIAGNGLPGDTGDGGPATAASLNGGAGLVFDTAGNLYIADASSYIREVSPSGVITTVGGNGVVTDSGDNGPVAAASFKGPWGLAFDTKGNLYVSDDLGNRIRQITPSGIVTTVAGVGPAAFSGDGGPANAATLNIPQGMALDSQGNLYVADKGNSRVRKITAAGIISTFAGNGKFAFTGDGGPAASASLSNPDALAFDKAGNLYIADYSNSRVRKVDPSGNISTYVAGHSPTSLAFDAAGNLFFGDDIGYVFKAAPGTAANIGSGGIVDGASFGQKSIAPGTIVSIFGSNFATGTASASSVPLPTTLGGVSVFVNGQPAGIFFVSTGQINFQMPWSTLYPGSATVTVGSVTATVTLALTSPGIFTVNSSGSGQGAIQIANTAIFAAPVGSIPGSQAQPVARGQFITIYCSGLGAVFNQPASGSASSGQTTSATPALTIGGVSVTPTFSGLAPGYVGLYQVNAQIPQSVSPGAAVAVVLTAGGVASNQVTIAVQ